MILIPFLVAILLLVKVACVLRTVRAPRLLSVRRKRGHHADAAKSRHTAARKTCASGDAHIVVAELLGRLVEGHEDRVVLVTVDQREQDVVESFA